jgi:hypothetical protein
MEQLKLKKYTGQTAAIAAYPDQLTTMYDLGVNAAFNIYSEAGSGFAKHVIEQLEPKFDR